MRGSRTKDKLKAKVIEAKINTPDITLKEIQAETGVNYETARKVLDTDMPEVVKTSENVKNLFERNCSLQSAADTLIAEMLAKKDTNITIAQLTSLRDSTFKQNQVIEMAKGGKDDSKTIVIQI
jgi:hypothetical protein